MLCRAVGYFFVATVVARGWLPLLVVNAATTASAAAADNISENHWSFFMIGNSYTYFNDLPGVFKRLLQHDAAVVSDMLARGGAKLQDYLHTSPSKAKIHQLPWTWVVLQEQSQVPGFYDVSDNFEKSVEAASQLNEWIAQNTNEHHPAPTTALLLTWGRRAGDEWNPGIYRDFPSMQKRLTIGYTKMQTAISTPARPVPIVPAGLAFQMIYESLLPGNATADGTMFSDLYDADGSHPSLQGTYLVACVLYATLADRDPRALGDAPVVEILPDRVTALQTVAYETVQKFTQENVINQQYQQYWAERQKSLIEKNEKSSLSGNDNDDNRYENPPKVSSGTRAWILVISICIPALITTMMLLRYNDKLSRQRQEYKKVDTLEDDMELVDCPPSRGMVS